MGQETGSSPLKVLVIPDFRSDNPYQQLLCDHVPAARAKVLHAVGYRRVLPIFRQVMAHRPDVLHLHWLNPFLPRRDLPGLLFFGARTLCELALIRLSGTALVWTIHNMVPHEARHRGLETTLNRWVARLANRVIVHSRSAWEEVRAPYRLLPARASVIPHGHYRSCYDPAPPVSVCRRRLGLPEGGKVVLFLGLLRPYKGLESLIHTWAELERAGQTAGARLLIAGKALDADYETELRRAAAAVPSIDFRPGFVADADVPVFFGAADAAVLPFARILTSGSLLLAMSFACPVISPALAPVREALGEDGGLLYDPDAPDGLRHTLLHALSADLAPVRERVRRRCDRLGWEAIGEGTTRVYEVAAGRRPAATLEEFLP